MKRNRLQAIDHVCLRAPFGMEQELIDFYTGVGELESLPPSQSDEAVLRFKSSLIELRIDPCECPAIDKHARRLTLVVTCLETVEEALAAQKQKYARVSGLGFTDRRILVRDPVGHLVELKQEWPLL